MDSAKLNDWLQVLGMFALVVSLVFVGLQMKQQQEIAIAGQYQSRYETTVELLTAMEQSPYELRRQGQRVVALWGLPEGYDAKISHEELGSAFIFARLALFGLENWHFQHEMGLLVDEAWEVYRKRIATVINSDDQAGSMTRFILRNYRDGHRASFVRLCDELMLVDNS